jgi:hypothetical protein
MRIRVKFVCASILLAGLVPVLQGETPSTPASASPSAAGEQPVPARIRGSLPAQTAATQPQVTFRDGLLSIRAENSTLGDVLRAVQNATGAVIESPGFASERVYVNLGPGGPRDILATLLNGSHYDYILLGSQQQPGSVVRVMLTMRQNSSEPPAAPSAVVRPTPPPPNPVANSNDNDTPDVPPDREAAANPNQPGQPAPGQPPAANAPVAAAQQQPGQPLNGQPPNGQPPNGLQPIGQPKTPEQLLRDLQQLQQQQQQQLQLQQQLMQQNGFSH